MSVEAVSYALKLNYRGDHCLKVVMVGISDCADNKHECFPGYKYLAEVGECDIRTAKRKVELLRAIGVVTVTGTRFRGANLYRVNVGAVPQWDNATGDTLPPVTGDTPVTDQGQRGDTEGGATSDRVVTRASRVSASKQGLDEHKQEPTTNQDPENQKQAPKAPNLPPGVSLESWTAWVEMRRKIPRSPFTPAAEASALATLWRRHAKGDDLGLLMECALQSSWKGLHWNIPREARAKRHPLGALGQAGPAAPVKPPRPPAIADPVLGRAWASIQAELAPKIAAEDREAWLNGAFLVSSTEEGVVIGGVPNNFFRTRILGIYRPQVETAVRGAFPAWRWQAAVPLIVLLAGQPLPEGTPWPKS